MATATPFKHIRTRLSVLMLLQFFIWGSWFVTIGNYMVASGLGSSISWAYSVGPIAAILSPFILGMLADRFFSADRVLFVLHAIGGIALLILPQITESASGFIAVLFIHTLCYMPTLGLANTVAFHHLEDSEKHFPAVRVFGTLGWIAAGILISRVFHADEKSLPLYIGGTASLLLAAYCLTLPKTPPQGKGKKVSIRDIFCLDALSLLKIPSFSIFLLSSLLICIPLSAYYAYAPVFLNDTGIGDPAFKLSFGQMSEIVFMLILPFFFKRLGIKKILMLGMAAWTARYALFALGAPDSITWMIMGGILLHGVCYDFFFVAGQIYVDQSVGAGIRAQAQGLLVLTTFGVGMLVGAQVAGWLFNEGIIGNMKAWSSYWFVPSMIALAVLILFTLIFREKCNDAN